MRRFLTVAVLIAGAVAVAAIAEYNLGSGRGTCPGCGRADRITIRKERVTMQDETSAVWVWQDCDCGRTVLVDTHETFW